MANIKILGSGHWREKRGTVNWVSCGSCEEWFHTNQRLTTEVDAGRSRFHCPNCQTEFEFDGAREIVLVPNR
ncbi:MAG: hypothetical protein CMM74_06050 [Rhodospirillaceae bacterium]|jgi:hypothetical protein|nr:hypothetical protein [Rhodospirillaceae bacterium]|tara:strand:+ start:216 stop:431 length:216 start_codon:yes stop_codon:yes gene_type:complete